MKILVSESSTAIGGQESAVLLHAEGLLKRGHDLRLILEPGSPICDMARQKGLPVDLVPMRHSQYPAAIRSYRALMARHRPAILQLNSSRDSWIGGLAARLVTPRPKVIRVRHISTPLNRNLTTRLLYRGLVDLVIVTGGERTRRAMIERDGLPAARVAAFPIGLDVDYFRPAPPDPDLRRELGLPDAHHLVGLISYLRTYKGHEYFIGAARRVLAQRRDVTFLIIGEGPEQVAIKRMIQSSGAAPHVRMLGFRSDLLNVFRSLDLFVIPSVEGDTIPQVLMQALAMEVPVVSTTVGSIPDVILDGETGFVVPPRNAELLADRIQRLLDDAVLRKQMGSRGRALVGASYSIDRMLDELEKVHQRVLDA
ncbi:MAG: glycosyltransferase [Nitrospiraceae bacterium]